MSRKRAYGTSEPLPAATGVSPSAVPAAVRLVAGPPTVEAGPGLTIGLHEARPIHPDRGNKDAMLIGLIIDEPIEGVVCGTRCQCLGTKASTFAKCWG